MKLVDGVKTGHALSLPHPLTKPCAEIGINYCGIGCPEILEYLFIDSLQKSLVAF